MNGEIGSGTAAVARLAGVSTATVSNALHRPEKVLPATRQKVFDAIQQLEFVPNRAAAALRQGTSKLIGLVIPDIENSFYSSITRGVTEEAAKRGYTVALCVTNDDGDVELECFAQLAELRAAGALVVPRSADSTRLHRLEAVGTHLVFIDRAEGDNACSVVIDDVTGGELAVKHLIDRHGPRIALVNGPTEIPQCADRREGALRALAESGLSAENCVEYSVDDMTIEAGYEIGESLGQHPPDGIFCTNDQLAVGVMRGLRSKGLDVPREVGVVGYGDLSLATDGVVQLTTIRQPKQELGRAAVSHLLAEISKPQSPHERVSVVFEPELVIRDSTR